MGRSTRRRRFLNMPRTAANASFANAETIEAPRNVVARGDTSDQLHKAARRQVAFVEGSAPHLSVETRNVLRSRLRASAVMLFIGFAVFLVWCTIQMASADNWGDFGVVYWVHIGVTAILGFAAWKLCAKCDLPLGYLRV